MSLIKVLCAQCTIIFGITEEFEEKRREDAQVFYCPVGHGNVYNKPKAEVVKLDVLPGKRATMQGKPGKFWRKA